jgi:membrane protease subunit (stomatin/prohibitin family)
MIFADSVSCSLKLYINSITPPLEVQKAIDDKSRVSAFDDLNRLLQMKAAMAAVAAQGKAKK